MQFMNMINDVMWMLTIELFEVESFHPLTNNFQDTSSHDELTKKVKLCFFKPYDKRFKYESYIITNKEGI